VSDLRTFRPGSSRIVAYGVAVIMIVLTTVIGVALPSYVTFSPLELATLAAMLVAVLALLHGVGRSYVRAGDDSIEVLNGYRRHSVPWSEIAGFSMKDGAPWPTMVHGDDERLILFAIQSSDGRYADEAMAYLRDRLT